MNTVLSACMSCGATYRSKVQICPNCKAPIKPDLPDFAPGEIVDDKYEIVSLLGKGGMGEVYKVRHVHLNTFRTIKVMRRTLLADETYRSRFAREARLATLLHHPNVAVVHDFSTLAGGSYYMVGEFIEGITVRRWSGLYGHMPYELAVEIAMQTLGGLEHIHRAGLLHRDLSADNIMISVSDRGDAVAKIIDLGIAKRVSGTASGDSTMAGIFVGNPRYSSPEQLGALSEGEEIDARADIYCFGVVLYEMLAGVPPFVSNTPDGYAAKHLAQAPPPLLSQPGARDVPPALQELLEKALEKDRSRRHQSAKELATALAPFRVPLPENVREKLAMLRRDAAGATNMTRSGPLTVSVPSEEDVLSAVELMSQHGDLSGLSKLAQHHSGETVVGQAVREAIGRLAPMTVTPPPLPTPAPQSPPPSSRVEWQPAPQVSAPHTPAPVPHTPAPPPAARSAPPRDLPWQKRALLEAALLVVLALAIYALVRAAYRDASVTVDMPEPVRAATAQLVLDATPWARIASVRGQDGELIQDEQTFTPANLLVAPGTYTIVMEAPDGATKTVEAVIDGSAPKLVRVQFDGIRVEQYFRGVTQTAN